MALRQRKAKDPVLPLYTNNSIVPNHKDDDESSSKRGRPSAPTPLSPLPRRLSKEGSSLLYTVYIPLVAFFVIAFGLAYVVIGGGGGDGDGDGNDLSQRHHHRPVSLRPHKHYHQHTAGRMKEGPGRSSTILKEKQPRFGIAMPSPNKQSPENVVDNTKSMLLEVISYPADHMSSKTVGTIKVRCPDGAEGILNDDYCDCADGSDESTTSACSHITVQNSMFHCLDKTGTIYTSRVRDGVKDCIDGSDEVWV